MREIRLEYQGKNENLLERLRREQIYFPAPCGGRGTCGKCRVRFVSEAPEASEDGKKFFTEAELADGWRLACRVTLEGPVVLELPDADEDEIAAAAGFAGGQAGVSAADGGTSAGSHSAAGGENSDSAESTGDAGIIPEDADCVIAVDIGTTTLAASLVDRNSGRVLKTVTSVNHQRAYGTDVVSRMDASNNGKAEELQQSILNDLAGLARKLGMDPETVPYVIAGNTTMQHLLQGLSCRTLGVAPYDPVDISLHNWRNMQMMPGISTFVGADIVSGMIAVGMDESEEISLLVDLGTNGEMVIGSKDRMISASTAAGPAFEGGNISCGVAGVPGAISSVVIEDGEATVGTIGDKPAIGLCGTGVLETVYELLKDELVDETGLMDDDYFDDGFPLAEGVIFTNKDVREVQLAKSAIRAGIEVLLQEYGVDYDGVANVYIAGGFGEKINQEKAIGIGLLPEEFAGKIIPIGNSSLAGAVMLAKDPSLGERFARVAAAAGETALAENPKFNDLYMDHMFFPEQ
ncbi:MAG: DUF4445 domain-containing protein [Eubacterium sp.]|nr:DUF4445 domain-containing protein [Eubacterium sp.]